MDVEEVIAGLLLKVECLQKQNADLLLACERAAQVINERLNHDRRVDYDADFIDVAIARAKGFK